jgi:hypothetical protein
MQLEWRHDTALQNFSEKRSRKMAIWKNRKQKGGEYYDVVRIEGR